MDNVILTLVTTGYAYRTVYSNTSGSQPQGQRAIKGSAWPILWLLLRLISQIRAIREVLGCMCGPHWNSCNPVLRPLLRFIPPKLRIGKMRRWSGEEGFSYFLPDDNYSLATARPINPGRNPVTVLFHEMSLVSQIPMTVLKSWCTGGVKPSLSTTTLQMLQNTTFTSKYFQKSYHCEKSGNLVRPFTYVDNHNTTIQILNMTQRKFYIIIYDFFPVILF